MYVLNRSLTEIRSQHAGIRAHDVSVAIHEAAHAVVALSLGFRVAEVLIRPSGSGHCRLADGHRSITPDVAAIWSIAGYEGEVKFDRTDGTRPDVRSSGYDKDLEGVRKRWPELTDQDIERERLRASRVLDAWVQAVDQLASDLLRKRTLDEAAIRAAVLSTADGDLLANHWKSFPQGEPEPTRSATPAPTWKPTPSRSEMIRTLEQVVRTPAHQLPDRVRRILDRLDQSVSIEAPSYRVGNTRVETRNLIPGLRYGDAHGMEVR